VELYAALGDQAKQNEIRAGNPAKHCQLLIKNPRACSGCPVNPYEADGRRQTAEGIRLLQENPQAIETALWLEQRVRMGMLELNDLSAPEVEAVRVAREEIERQHRRELSQLVGYEVAVIIAKMFEKK
jgi:hypothetical protein